MTRFRFRRRFRRRQARRLRLTRRMTRRTRTPDRSGSRFACARRLPTRWCAPSAASARGLRGSPATSTSARCSTRPGTGKPRASRARVARNERRRRGGGSFRSEAARVVLARAQSFSAAVPLGRKGRRGDGRARGDARRGKRTRGSLRGGSRGDARRLASAVFHRRSRRRLRRRRRRRFLDARRKGAGRSRATITRAGLGATRWTWRRHETAGEGQARGAVFGVRGERPANVGVSEPSRAQRRGRVEDDVRALRRALREAEQALRAPQDVAVRRAGRGGHRGARLERRLLGG